MIQAKRGKTKELSKKEASERAKVLVGGLYGGNDWSGLIGGFDRLPASHRRAVLGAAKELSVDRTRSVDKARLIEVARSGLRSGPTNKPEFLVSLVEAVLGFCNRFEPRESPGAMGDVLASLLKGGAQHGGEATLEFSVLNPAELAKINEIGTALKQMIQSDHHRETLKKTMNIWGRLLGALLGTRRASVSLGASEALAVLRLMSGLGVSSVPAELMLSVPWLADLAGGVPQDIADGPPFATIPASLKRQAALGDAGTATAGETKSPPPAEEPDAKQRENRLGSGGVRGTSGLFRQIEEVIARYEELAEQRRKNLSDKLDKAEKEKGDLSSQMETLRSQIIVLDSKRQDLSAQLRNAEQSEATIASERDSLRQERDKWQREMAAVADSRSRQIEDAKVEVRLALKSSILTHLVNLHSYLTELKQSGASDAARYAATAFDEIIRTLHRQNYVTATELPRLHA
ncbi:MAG: hypothetical protein ACYC1T_06895 [Sulfuricaulis sp.]